MILKPQHRRELKIALFFTALNAVVFLAAIVRHEPIAYGISFLAFIGFVLWLGDISDRLGKYN